MATQLNLQVAGSTGDGHSGTGTDYVPVDPNARITSGTGGIGGVDELTNVWLQPGDHGGANCTAAAHFTNVTVPQGATIDSATFTLRAEGYNASPNVIKYVVCAEASDSAPALAYYSNAGGSLAASGAASPPGNRPRTTETVTWTQTTVSAGTEYSCTITNVIQEIVNRAGWASGNAILIIVDTHTDTTNSEWQNYYSYDGNASYAPKLSITYSTGATNIDRAPGVGTVQATGSAGTLAFTMPPGAGALQFAGATPTVLEQVPAQYAYPTSDVSNESWTASVGGDLYACVDEDGTPSDTDYIRSPAAPTGHTAVLQFGSLNTPDAGTVTLRVRAKWVA